MVPLFASLVLRQGPTLPPAVGEKAPAFDVRTLDDRAVRLAPLLKGGPVVLVVLRGYPGYQCPFCTKQVGELFAKAGEFRKRKSTVVLVYPGPSDHLKRYANEFVSGKEIPADYRYALDPDFAFTKSYGLRWDAPHETAYPSAFVIGRDGRIAYAKVGRGHGDRAPVADLLASLDGLSR